MRALVTGAGGFVGVNLVRRLLADGHECHVVLRQQANLDRLADLAPGLQRHECDVRDRSRVLEVFSSTRPEVVFHLAAYGAYTFQPDFEEMVGTNLLALQHLIDAAVMSSCPILVNTGSSAEYGDRDHAPNEDEALQPNSHYAITKAAGTWLCRMMSVKHQIRIPTLRMYSAYGPFEDERRLIPALISRCLEGGWPPLASPETVRDFVYVEDVVDAYLRIAVATPDDRARVYNVGSGQQTTLRELVSTAQDLFQVREPARWGDYPSHHWDTRVWVSDPRRIMQELDWRPAHSLRDGLRLTAEWMSQRSNR